MERTEGGEQGKRRAFSSSSESVVYHARQPPSSIFISVPLAIAASSFGFSWSWLPNFACRSKGGPSAAGPAAGKRCALEARAEARAQGAALRPHQVPVVDHVGVLRLAPLEEGVPRSRRHALLVPGRQSAGGGGRGELPGTRLSVARSDALLRL